MSYHDQEKTGKRHPAGAGADFELAAERRAREPYASRRIGLRLAIGREQISVRISDDGPGFDPSGLPDPTAPGYLERPCGRGIMLMRTFMDDIRFNEKGNEVTLIKRRVAPAETTSGGGEA